MFFLIPEINVLLTILMCRVSVVLAMVPHRKSIFDIFGCDGTLMRLLEALGISLGPTYM